MKSASPIPIPTVVSEKPYQFVPPKDSRFWPWFACTWIEKYLWRVHGLESFEVIGLDKLRASLAAGHGILIVPNHPRPADPMAMGMLSKPLKQPFYAMASSHIFNEGRLQPWLLPRVGAFSVYREGLDRESLKTAIDILAKAKRPLVVFAEGVITRTNDRLINLQDGVAFMARSAARQRASSSPPGIVVIHPLALRYKFCGDAEKSLAPVLESIEQRLSWVPRRGRPLAERVARIGHALLALKELEYFGAPQFGTIEERLSRLLDGVLVPLENEWLKGHREDTVVHRVKALRKAVVPELVAGDLTEDERLRRWKQLFDIEMAQQLYHFPPAYLGESPTPERLIETVERYEEGLGAKNPTRHAPWRLHFEIGDAIVVDPARDRRALSDPVMDQLHAALVAMLGLEANGARSAGVGVARASGPA